MISLKFNISSSYINSKDLNKTPIMLSLEERIRNSKKFLWYEKVGTKNKYSKITPEEWKEVLSDVQEPTPLMQEIIDLSLQEEYIIFAKGSKITFGKDTD